MEPSKKKELTSLLVAIHKYKILIFNNIEILKLNKSMKFHASPIFSLVAEPELLKPMNWLRVWSGQHSAISIKNKKLG